MEHSITPTREELVAQVATLTAALRAEHDLDEQTHGLKFGQSKQNCRACAMLKGSEPPKIFVLEGTWSGYRAAQRKVVHREVVSAERAARVGKITTICFTDRTTLDVVVRPLLAGEAVKELHGYTELLDDAEAKGLEGFIEIPF